LVTDEGFILINDYGSMQSAGSEDFQHQRYSGATFVGINFPLLKAYCGNRDSSWIEPAEEDASIHARLLGRQLAPGTVACFHERFSSTALQNLHEPVEMARNCVKSGRFEAALTAYQRALELQPQNWLLMNEVANFLTFPLRSPAAGLKMARAGLARNPNCSAELWNTLGDSLFTLGSVEDARRAYLRALRVNREDVRARYNLAYVYTQTSQHALALKMIGEALWLDTAGTFREGLLHRQSEILTWLTQGHQEHYLRTVNRVSIHQQPGPAKGRNALTGREVAIGPNQQQSTHIISNQPSKSGAIQLAQ